MPVYFLEILVVALGLVILLADAFAKLEDKRSLAKLGVLGLAIIFGLVFLVEAPASTGGTFWKFYSAPDGVSLFFKGLSILTTLLVLVMAHDYSPVVLAQTAGPEKGAHPQAGLGEFYALPIFACAGLMWMASATNLVSIFVALETVSITFYILVAYLRRNVGSLEAGVKYLILGALSTGFLVYGFAWLFGITGTMDLAGIKATLANPEINPTTALFAFALILIALAFKVGAAPFHFWIPDVYQGAPTPITAFLSVGSKAAGFIVALRLITPFLEAPALVEKAGAVLAGLAVLTLLIGNLAAIPQKNFKRLLAYSSVGHSGFLLMMLASAPPMDSKGLMPVTAISFYLGAYLLMTLLAFLVLTALRPVIAGEDLDAFRGLGRRSPFLAAALMFAMASLAGIPLTAGFFGKFFAFQLAVASQQWTLLACGLVAAAAGFYFYLRIAVSMYFTEPAKSEEREVIPVHPLTGTVMVILMVLIVLAGVAPGVILGLLS